MLFTGKKTQNLYNFSIYYPVYYLFIHSFKQMVSVVSYMSGTNLGARNAPVTQI